MFIPSFLKIVNYHADRHSDSIGLSFLK